MPNGITAPGNTLPPLAVPINGLTAAAGSATAATSSAEAGAVGAIATTSAAATKMTAGRLIVSPRFARRPDE